MKTLALALCLLAPCVHAQWWSPGGGGMGNQVGFAYQRDHIEMARMEIERAFAAGEIDKLERMHDEFLALQKAGAMGRFMMSAFNGVVGSAAQDKAKLAATIERWKQERPRSALRPVLESATFVRSAWAHRGGGYANTVSPEAMKLFQADLERAAAVLQKAGSEARATPLYYSQAIAIAGASGRPRAVVDAIFAEGVAKFPIDWSIHDNRLNYLLPQWGGSMAEMERFIRDAAIRTQSTEGTGMYARLWASYVGSVREEGDFFVVSGVQWPTLRHAFEDALALENHNGMRNYYATFACMAKDRETLRRVARQLGKYADYGGARDYVSPDACEEMARADP
jgi:hypothetical protein